MKKQTMENALNLIRRPISGVAMATKILPKIQHTLNLLYPEWEVNWLLLWRVTIFFSIFQAFFDVVFQLHISIATTN